jgi:hypothetical protein
LRSLFIVSDIIYTIIFSTSLAGIAAFSYRYIKKNYYEMPGVSNYAVVVDGIPNDPKKINVQQLREHFLNLDANVIDVQFAR